VIARAGPIVLDTFETTLMVILSTRHRWRLAARRRFQSPARPVADETSVRCRLNRVTAVLALGVVVLAAGCSRPTNPWVYAEPPAVHINAMARPLGGRTVIAVAEFRNPDAPQLSWDDVGAEMTRAFRRALFNESDFEVRLAPELEAVVSQPGYLLSNPDPAMKTVDVDYVMIGQVTDFHHTAGLPKEVSRWGIIARRREAVVAIEWKIVDVRRHRVVAADHTFGAAKAGWSSSIEKQYAGLDISAYLFWNTPLGRAAHQAIDATISRMRELLPTVQPHQQQTIPVITAMHPGRKIEVQGGTTTGLQTGQDLYVAVAAAGGGTEAVHDVDTGLPLMVRIGAVSRDSSVAWLLGKPPDGVPLLGATLTSQMPPDPSTAARQAMVGP